ncbi:S-adenosyl-L-methionine-dependent methyltransferase [Lentinus tigrinus ALCF2SS1-6]|uniref:DNA (cytosine-5-)-methyltransferase n=1 Tax=Lentinus tigrinus ALCF2SS1-6 TaxID=1328759 RepID=A0A5C2SNC2_9APHY|nr:S-adenosyl-L-methionine-dependent methyltransferase [Lentinus tigrinus ALCF2SS1-6]
MAKTGPTSPEYVLPARAVTKLTALPEHVCNITGTEAREGEALVPGEDPEERLDTVDDEPVRILNDFAIFDPSRGFNYVPLDHRNASGKAEIEAVGHVSPAFMNEEDADQDDDVDDNHPTAHPRWRTTSISCYSIDYTAYQEPLYVQTRHAWYILKLPNADYAATHAEFYRPHRIAQIVISAAMGQGIMTYSQFQEQYVDAWDDLLGARVRVQDLCEAVPLIKSFVGDDVVLNNRVASRPFVQEIYSLAEKTPSVYIDRSLPQLDKDLTRRRPKLKKGLMLGNLDLAVLRPENQNPTHVTPLIDSLAHGLFQESLHVVGPRTKRPAKHELRRQQQEMRSYVCRLLYRNLEDLPRVSFPTSERLRDEYWNAVLIRGELYKVGDCIVVPKGDWNGVEGGELPRDLSVSEVPEDATLADYFWFGKIIYIDQRLKKLHIQWFEHSSKTYLGKISDPHELFLCPLCGYIDLKAVPVLGKLTVHHPRPPKPLGPLEFFYQFVYNEAEGSFTDVALKSDDDAIDPPDNCLACIAAAERSQETEPCLTRDSLMYLGHTYHADDYALVQATDGPANIGRILSFHDKKGSSPTVTLRLLGRIVELTSNIAESSLPELLHERELCMTNAKPVVVNAKDLLRRCTVLHANSAPEMGLEEWLNLSPLHFYVRYSVPSQPPLWSAREELKRSNIPVCIRCYRDHLTKLEQHEALRKEPPLRAFDPFAGCGAFGFSMEELGHMKVTHAVEISPSAADTVKKNSPTTVVYNQCANIVLKYAVKAHAGQRDEVPQHIGNELPLPPPPAPGQIDCIVAGFPCQSHSTLNMYQRAHDRKSHLMLTLLSWVDFLRPKYCFFENVKGFLSYNLHSSQASRYRVEGGIDKGGLKFLVHALVAMGYQVRFGLLNAGHYGTPQGRIRFFLIAAKHGYPLPNLPTPSHASLTNETLTIHLADKMDITPLRASKGIAPMKHVSIQDAIGDLLQFDWYDKLSANRRALLVRNSDRLAVTCDPSKARCGPEDMGITDMYSSEPRTAFQRRCRRRPVIEPQHFTRTFNERVSIIYTAFVKKCLDNWPAGVFRDYRDLPVTEQDWALINPQSATSRLGFPPGYYGRLDKNSWFRTISTNLQPMAKQCQVTHYECCRIYTVREFARSQGFPDWFVFVAHNGQVKNMHRQIGNAVPWQIGEALGRELCEAQLKRRRKIVEDAIEILDE